MQAMTSNFILFPRLLPAFWVSCAFATALATAAVAVPTVQVQRAAVPAGFELEGTLQAVKQSTLAAQAQGNLLTIAVKAGDRVKAGQVLARMDARDTQAGVMRAEAAVAQAQAERDQATVVARRQRDLRAQGFVSQAVVDQAENQLKAVQAALGQAQAVRTQAGLAQGHTTLVAPFDGVVLATHAQAGELATPGRPIATVYAPGAMRAVVQVPQTRQALARAASPSVTLPDGKQVTPQGVQALAGVDAVAQTVEWRLELPPGETGLPGQSVWVQFPGAGQGATPAAAATALRLPESAVLRRGELEAVYVVRDQRFVLRHVRTGASAGSNVEVLAGLQAGERVALDAIKAGLSGAVPAP
jgi:RND family efflux transporter MFP subunit